ncbi:hypothetical protein [Nocardia yamanashiensis]|uniref:hypothetical protein n=1 Tax=Nocardia yamanashiensis TaxID=209247 RepID=UPI0012FE4E8B|nr:hypothetical protein [Nocardia yamanashiensis]
MSFRALSGKSRAAVVMGLLAVLVRVESKSERTVGSVVTECGYVNYAGLVLGALTLVVAANAV